MLRNFDGHDASWSRYLRSRLFSGLVVEVRKRKGSNLDDCVSCRANSRTVL